MDLVNEVKTLGGWSQPNAKTFKWKGSCYQTIYKDYDDA